jgi:YHS domain-containing protein
MIRLVFYAVLLILFARAMGRLWSGVVEGLTGQPPGSGSDVPARGVQMVRDPVCGTFVVPRRAVMLVVGRDHLYFCSATCRDQYRARPSTRSGHPEPAEGRTA